MNLFRRKGMLDVIVVFGLFVASAILVLGLLPFDSGARGRLLYLYTMMTVPILIAIYFIFVTFRKSVKKSNEAESSLRAKFTLIFIFISTVPLIPVVFISNSVIKRAVESVASADVGQALRKSIDLSKNELTSLGDGIRNELNGVNYSLERGIVSIDNYSGRRHLTEIFRAKGLTFKCYQIRSRGAVADVLESLDGDSGAVRYSEGIRKFISLQTPVDASAVSHINVESVPILVGAFNRGDMIVAAYKVIPAELFSRILSFTDAYNRYIRKNESRDSTLAVAGLMLLIVSIVVVVASIGISLYVSRSVTFPMLEIADAAKSVASGNFDVTLSRETNDEIATLYKSFNSMTRQLKENRDAMYIAQKLNAWREVGKKILHEIKNPLTPIRLSAERIRRHYTEKKEDMGNAIMKGTDVIIEEVTAIQRILDEFSNFARLPEINPEPNNLNEAIKSFVASYSGHEKIKFVLNLDTFLRPVLFDKLLLKQAALNIMKNAIEAMNDNGTIEVTTGNIDSVTAFFSVRDHGPGISKEDIERLFEPTFTRTKGGTGLGLAIVEKIALDHRGRVYCKSKIGDGATFTMELPLARHNGF